MRRREFLPLLLAAAAPAPSERYAPEPAGLWLGPVHGAVPASIAGGTVLNATGLARLISRDRVVLLDVADAPHRPDGLPPNTLWLPPPHRDIPGSVWIPGIGRGALPPQFAEWYRSRLAGLTGGDRNRPVIVYCHPRCWMSWNAAKRAILDGYQRVYWYPGGVEGWQKAHYATAIVQPEGPYASR